MVVLLCDDQIDANLFVYYMFFGRAHTTHTRGLGQMKNENNLCFVVHTHVDDIFIHIRRNDSWINLPIDVLWSIWKRQAMITATTIKRLLECVVIVRCLCVQVFYFGESMSFVSIHKHNTLETELLSYNESSDNEGTRLRACVCSLFIHTMILQ